MAAQMRKVKIITSPITDRIVKENSTGEIDATGQHIRVAGCWFNFDDRWKVEDLPAPSTNGQS